MHDTCIKTAAILILTLMGTMCLWAQPKAIGTAYSFSGISAVYEHEISEETFLDASVKAELGEVFNARASFPGASASISWNLILKKWEREEGESFRLFAGTGIHAGWGNDMRKAEGFNFGLKGRFGLECLFKRKVSVSLVLAPVIGMHMTVLEESLKMEYYRNGLLNGIMPEIGIRYAF